MNCLGLVEEMKRSPQLYKPLFIFSTQSLAPTAHQLLEEVFSDVEVSEPGSNTRAMENNAICFWRDYVLDAQGKVFLVIHIALYTNYEYFHYSKLLQSFCRTIGNILYFVLF